MYLSATPPVNMLKDELTFSLQARLLKQDSTLVMLTEDDMMLVGGIRCKIASVPMGFGVRPSDVISVCNVMHTYSFFHTSSGKLC